MRRTLASLALLALVFAVSAQPPVPPSAPMPPSLPSVIPATGTNPAPAAGAEGTLAQFEPLNAFPAATQSAVRSVIYGSNWLTRMNQPNGRFQYGYRPALRQAMNSDHDLMQARAALAMVQSARFTGNERQSAIAGQSLLALLALTKLDPADPNCRIPVASSLTCNRVGFAAALVLGIYELPGSDEKLLAEAERLCEFLHRQLRTDGSVHYIDSPNELAAKADPAGVNEYPGAALQAIARSNRVKPAAWKTEALKKGIEHYRAYFKANPHPMLAATLTPAFTECCLQTKSDEAAAAVIEMSDWLISLQYAGSDPRFPQRVGGFRSFANGQPADTEPGFECGCYVHSIACGYHLLRFNPDIERAARYKQSLVDGVGFLTSLQYTEANTRHFENNFRANSLIGGFHLTPTDGNLRIDASAACLSGLIRYLNCGAEKN